MKGTDRMTATETMSRVSTWTIDSSHSLVEFSVKHLMITTVKGRFGSVAGTLSLDAERPERSSASVTIDAASIDTRTEQRDQHLRSADFLDVANHPSLGFESTRVVGSFAGPGDSFQLIGRLTIRGITKEVTLDAVFEGTGKDPWGNERASFSATTKIDRRDFGLLWNQALETGGLLVGNEIKISLEAQATRAG
jgi:polyisoprenoid-binding protein YceI